MNNTTVSKGGMATAFVVALVSVLVWALGYWHIAVVPDQVQGALIVILTPIVHTIAVRLGVDGSTSDAAPAVPAAPAAKVEPHMSGPSPLARSQVGVVAWLFRIFVRVLVDALVTLLLA